MMAKALKVNPKQEKILDSRAVWGKFLLALREAKELSLHSICVELSDYAIEDNTFVVNVGKKIDYDSLKKLQNVKKINDIFASLSTNLVIEIRFKPKEVEDKTQVISQILGCEVIKK